MKRVVLLGLIVVASLGSCMTTKTSVGNFKEGTSDVYVHDKGKQLWLFWGVIPLGRTNVSTPTNGGCQVITKFRITDALITCLTGGIITSYSIKVKARKTETK